MGGGPKPTGAPFVEAVPGTDGAANCPGGGGLIQVLATGAGAGVTVGGIGAAAGIAVSAAGSAGDATGRATLAGSGLAAARQRARAKSPSWTKASRHRKAPAVARTRPRSARRMGVA